MSTVLPVDLAEYVAGAVAAGKYASEGALVAEAVRRLRDEENYQRFKTQLSDRIERTERGECIELNSDDELAEFFSQIKNKVNAEMTSG